jgi:hypothetical protein
LNVQKSTIIVPPNFGDSVRAARSKAGLTFAQYLKCANQVYRKKDKRAQLDFPLVPDSGLKQEWRTLARTLLAPNESKVRGVGFVWDDLPSDVFFELDRDENEIALNRHFRDRLLGGRRASATDVPLIKVLLFLLLEEDLDQRRVTTARKTRLESINKLLATITDAE